MSGWSSDRFLSWAEKTGPCTRELIRHILESREYPVQTYRACMGIMRLSKSYGAEIMEAASRDALDKNTYSFKYFSIIIKQIASKAATANAERIITHENVRGRNAFSGGGIHA